MSSDQHGWISVSSVVFECSNNICFKLYVYSKWSTRHLWVSFTIINNWICFKSLLTTVLLCSSLIQHIHNLFDKSEFLTCRSKQSLSAWPETFWGINIPSTITVPWLNSIERSCTWILGIIRTHLLFYNSNSPVSLKNSGEWHWFCSIYIVCICIPTYLLMYVWTLKSQFFFEIV